MVAALLLGLALQGSALQQVTPNPTGRNGYEELVRAGEFLKAQRFGDYMMADAQGPPDPKELGNETSKGGDAEPPSPATLAVWDQLRGKTLLQRRRWARERFSPAIDLLYKAAEKPIFDPRTKVDLTTLFPELSTFKDLAKLVPIVAYVDFADGKNDRAVRLYSTSLDVFERTAYGTLIQYLVGVACHAIVFASIEEHLIRLSQADAKKLEEAAATILSRSPGVKEAILGDAKYTISSLETLFKDPSSIGDLSGFGEDEDPKAKAALAALSPDAKVRLIKAVQQRLGDETKQFSQRFDGPESGWIDTDEVAASKPDWGTFTGMVDAISDGLTPVYSQVGVSAARSRTQLRLLGLLSSVIRYRWEHNQMPNRLEDAVGKDRVMDPLSQLPFELRRDGASGFSIVSKGVKQTGEIALRYRRQLNSGTPGPP